jgi:serine/threonine-protein kinase HipA
MARVLDVYLGPRLAGHFTQDDSGSLWFAYAADWLADARAVPLSRSLPLRAEPYERNQCRPFFAGLLPEDEGRELIARRFGISGRNDFALLEKIGGECAGAVSLMPPGEVPPEVGAYHEIPEHELARLLGLLPQRPLLAGEEGIRLSLAGAQAKLAVAIRGENFQIPLGAAPSTHILKPASPLFEGLVENEHFCMILAARVGLSVAGASIGKAGAIPFLQVVRYDRRRLADGTLERLHQEDFCQAMGIPPELKYQQEGGPNLKKCFDLIRSASTAPGLDVLRLFDAVIFNYLIGNHDAHGKNFSLLYDESSVRLAPLYDLVCTQAWENLASTMAMKIGDARKPERVFAANWRKFFKDAGLGEATAEKRLQSLAKTTVAALRELAESHSAGARLCPIITENGRHLLSLDW